MAAALARKSQGATTMAPSWRWMPPVQRPPPSPVEAWIADPDYQEAVAFRHASPVMHRRRVQEGGGNAVDPEPHAASAGT